VALRETGGKAVQGSPPCRVAIPIPRVKIRGAPSCGFSNRIFRIYPFIVFLAYVRPHDLLPIILFQFPSAFLAGCMEKYRSPGAPLAQFVEEKKIDNYIQNTYQYKGPQNDIGEGPYIHYLASSRPSMCVPEETG